MDFRRFQDGLNGGLPRRALAQTLLNAFLLGAWIWLYRPVFAYLGTIFTREEFRTNQILLLGILALIIGQMRVGSLRLRPAALPRLYLPALVLTVGGSLFFVLTERFLDVNTLSAGLFGLASYGLMGLWISPARWRRGAPAALLLVGTLPFGDHMQTFIGYPVRLHTATLVREGLASLGHPSVGVDTILVFESGISQVDLPCSGVRSLWTGGLFFLAATWIEKRRLNVRWLFAAFLFAALLLIANLARVGILVSVGEVAGWRLLAEMLHVPLGVLGFVAACVAALAMLRRTSPAPTGGGVAAPGPQDQGGEGMGTGLEGGRPDPDPRLPHPGWLVPLLTGVVVALALFYQPRPTRAAAPTAPAWIFPYEVQVESWPLLPGELEWLNEDGPVTGDRWRFRWRELSGSVLLVTSESWRGQHRPERCFQVYGLSLDEERTVLIAPEFPLRVLGLGGAQGEKLYTATYWFQSRDRVTEDFATRIWADVGSDRGPWVLVTVLYDQPLDPYAPALRELALQLRSAISQTLEGGP